MTPDPSIVIGNRVFSSINELESLFPATFNSGKIALVCDSGNSEPPILRGNKRWKLKKG